MSPSIYWRYKHGASVNVLVREHGVDKVCNSFKRNGLTVKKLAGRIMIWDEVTERWKIMHVNQGICR